MKAGDVLGLGSKETWALISIMVYAFVIHARFVPSLEENGLLT
jgi:ABC-type transport system involved in cytochrome c biogenesis permease subunit